MCSAKTAFRLQGEWLKTELQRPLAGDSLYFQRWPVASLIPLMAIGRICQEHDPACHRNFFGKSLDQNLSRGTRFSAKDRNAGSSPGGFLVASCLEATLHAQLRINTNSCGSTQTVADQHKQLRYHTDGCVRSLRQERIGTCVHHLRVKTLSEASHRDHDYRRVPGCFACFRRRLCPR